MFYVALGAVIYCACVWFTAGVIYASLQADFPSLSQSRKENIRDAAFCIMWSLVPLSWLLAPVFTSFYADGWMRPGATPSKEWRGRHK